MKRTYHTMYLTSVSIRSTIERRFLERMKNAHNMSLEQQAQEVKIHNRDCRHWERLRNLENRLQAAGLSPFGVI